MKLIRSFEHRKQMYDQKIIFKMNNKDVDKYFEPLNAVK